LRIKSKQSKTEWNHLNVGAMIMLPLYGILSCAKMSKYYNV